MRVSSGPSPPAPWTSVWSARCARRRLAPHSQRVMHAIDAGNVILEISRIPARPTARLVGPGGARQRPRTHLRGRGLSGNRTNWHQNIRSGNGGGAGAVPGVHAPAASCSPAVGGVQRRQQPRILSVVEATSAGLQRSGRRQPPAALWGRLRSDRLKEETVSFSALPERNSFHRYQTQNQRRHPVPGGGPAAAPRPEDQLAAAG